MNDYYTYAYLREDRTPYYIGKGRGKRAFVLHGKIPRPTVDRILFLKKNLSEIEAFRHEIYMIRVLGRKKDGGILLNFTDGGEGGSGMVHTEETRKAISLAQRGVPKPPGHGEKVSKAHRGKKYSEELKKKLSAAHTGVRLSAEHSRAISESLRGRIVTEEHKRKISLANKGKKRTEQSREKMRKSQLRQFQCTVTGAISSATGLTKIQTRLGIDISNRIPLINSR